MMINAPQTQSEPVEVEDDEVGDNSYYGKYLFCHAISKSSLFCHAANRFRPYYAMHHYNFCDSTSKHLIPLIFSHILKYYLVLSKTSTFYYRL